MALDKWFLLIDEGIEKDNIMRRERAELQIHEKVH